jgi:hypothetical protein
MLFWHAQRRNSPNQPPLLDQTLLPTSGGLTRILSEHAGQVLAMAAPTAEQRVLVEKLFRALIDTNAEGLAIRRPLRFAALAAECGAAPEALRPLIDAFRAVNVSFLTPYPPAEIDDDTVIDIGHEALIRCWDVIADPVQGWLKHEIDDGLIWRSLVVQAHDFLRDKKQLLSEKTTIERLRWVRNINESWAERYGGDWHSVTKLLISCKKDEGNKFFVRILTRSCFFMTLIMFLGVIMYSNSLLDKDNLPSQVLAFCFGVSIAISFATMFSILLFLLSRSIFRSGAFIFKKLLNQEKINVSKMPTHRQHDEYFLMIYRYKIRILVIVISVCVIFYLLEIGVDFLFPSFVAAQVTLRLAFALSVWLLLLLGVFIATKAVKRRWIFRRIWPN